MSKTKQITIRPVKIYDTEYLPLEQDTELYTKPDYIGMSASEYRNILIYRAIVERENYYQDHTPPAFGDPHYSQKDGYMLGLIHGYGLEFDEDPKEIRIKTKNGSVVMRVIRPKTTEAYKEAVRNNNITLKSFGV